MREFVFFNRGGEKFGHIQAEEISFDSDNRVQLWVKDEEGNNKLVAVILLAPSDFIADTTHFGQMKDK